MRPMRVPVLRVLCGQCLVPDDEQVLRVLLLRRLGEVEAPGEHRLAVDDHHLVVRNGVVGIDHGRHALIGEEVGGGVLLTTLALVQDDLHLHATRVGIEQRLRSAPR